MGNASQTTSSGYTGSRNSSIHSTWQGSSTQGRGRPASSHGKDIPGKGSRSSYLRANALKIDKETTPGIVRSRQGREGTATRQDAASAPDRLRVELREENFPDPLVVAALQEA